MSSVRRPSLSEQQSVNNQAKWQKDMEVTRCGSCNITFTFFQRRHHCRCCGEIFCQNCSNNFVRYDKNRVCVVRRPDSTMEEFAPYRTCDSCYTNLSHLGLIINVQPFSSSSSSSPSKKQNSSNNPTSQDTLDEGSSLSTNSDANPFNASNISGFPIHMEDTTTECDTFNRFTSETTHTDINDVDNVSTTETANGNTIHRVQGEEAGEDDDNDDRNTCPICNVNFKKISPEHDEHTIEQHVEECIRKAERIQQHHDNPPFSNSNNENNEDCNYNSSNNNTETNNDDSTCPTARNRMLVYKIPYRNNKNDELTINSDDYEECPICLEQMLPGEKVGRLECLCVFHYHCIKSWFVKKSQQVAAIEGINKIGKNFCPLHDAIF